MLLESFDGSQVPGQHLLPASIHNDVEISQGGQSPSFPGPIRVSPQDPLLPAVLVGPGHAGHGFGGQIWKGLVGGGHGQH
jgi:hypothetical protein